MFFSVDAIAVMTYSMFLLDPAQERTCPVHTPSQNKLKSVL